MNPHFAQGDYAGGVIAGLQDINGLIQGQTTGKDLPPVPEGFQPDQLH